MSGTLNHSPAQILQQLLVDLGVGATGSANSGWPISSVLEKETPDDTITIYDTTGTNDGRTQTDGQQQIHYGFQVKVRSANHETGYAKAKSIATILDETIQNDTVTVVTDSNTNTYVVYAVSRRGSVIPLGQERPSSSRYIFTINALVSLRQIS